MSAILNKYPLWKYIALMFVVVVGFIYALPNVFPEDPALQIAAVNTAVVDQKLADNVTQVLQKNDLKYKSVTVSSGPSLLVRFNDTDTQLRAKDYVTAAVGAEYTTALNLAATTPAWLKALGAQPMKLGLDLRGGVHFLMQVDTQSALTKRVNDDLRGIGAALREKHIRYAGLNQQANGDVVLQFRKQEDLADALVLLKSRFREYEYTQKQGGEAFEILGRLSPTYLDSERQDIVSQTMSVLRNRVDELGVAEPVVQQQGTNQIIVDLPGIQDAAQASQILGGTATLEFHLVDSSHDLQAAVGGQVPIGSQLYPMQDNNTPILLYSEVVLKGSSITSAATALGQDGRPTVSIRASGSGVSYFNKVTRDNVGKRMAIVYIETKTETKMVNGKPTPVSHQVEKVISAPVIQSALGNEFQITGLQSAREATNLAVLLRAGALPANIYPVEESVVGPSLGQANIDKGILSVEIGFIAIIVFMLFYYRFFGFVADLALFMNLVLLIAVLSILGATLTVPGIAAILLTLGMAVDANVLIFERIREELRNGMSPQASIHAGYERAFSTIVDANVTTLIAAVALFGLGSGSIKGFAINLTIGLTISMLTAITGTRAIVNLVYGGRHNLKRLSIGISSERITRGAGLNKESFADDNKSSRVSG